MKKLIVLVAALALLSAGCILHVTHYQRSDGSTVYVGELYNEGAPLNPGNAVQGKFYDASGNLITTQTGTICQGVNSKSVIPFKVVLPPGTAPAAKVDWSVVATPVANAYLATGLEASITSKALSPDGTTWFSGQIKNTSTNGYVGGYVCAAWYDAAGNVVRVSQATANQLRLGPGAAIPFVMIELLPPGATTSMNFFLDAGVVPPGMPPASLVDIPGTSYTHTSQKTFPFGSSSTARVSFGEIHNNGAQAIHAPLLSSTAQDAAGELVAGGPSTCPLDVAPGGFTFGSSLMVANGASITGAVDTIQAEVATKNISTMISTSGVQMQVTANGAAHVTGTVTNTSGTSLALVGVCAGVYDASGALIGTNATALNPAGGLGAGQSASFALDVLPFGTAASVTALAGG
ncbi:MAG: FxLYD domain-containing protein [Dehalococcoidia bacterium]